VNERLFQKLLEHVDLPIEYVFRFDGPINFTRLMGAYEMIKRPDLKFRPIQPQLPPEFATEESIFETIKKRDHLLHHPYESFDPVVKFVQTAARDPQVFAIKQTLYRTSGDSPIVAALIDASQNGKQVTALIELKARFDEANNIQWARQMEEAGVQVVYGIVGLKIHAKCCLVLRKEGNALKHYVHLGTGNYNPRTARLYTDFSFFTARTDITSEVALLFNTLTGYGRPPEFKKLLVAPLNLQQEIIRRINVEIENAKSGKPARIRAQLNSLIDRTVIDSLYAASHAGVKIELVIRGLCGLVPGVAGLSENISVRSIVGQFLEHARVYYFENGGKPLLYMGSADLMPRNLYRRIEVVFPIEDPALRDRIVNEFFPVLMRDTARARELRPNGSYEPIETAEGLNASAQEILLNTTPSRAKQP
jgi:polyphosphate kinase